MRRPLLAEQAAAGVGATSGRSSRWARAAKDVSRLVAELEDDPFS
jgi:hypothetical protein